MPEHECDRPNCPLVYTAEEDAQEGQSHAYVSPESSYVAVPLARAPLKRLAVAWETLDDEHLSAHLMVLVRDVFEAGDGTLNALNAVDL